MATLGRDTISAWQEGVTMFHDKDFDGAIFVLNNIPEENQTAKVGVVGIFGEGGGGRS